MRDAVCVRHKTHRVSNPPSLTGEDDRADEKPQAMRIASAGLDPAHLKRRGGGANNIGHSGLVARWRARCVFVR